MTISTLFALSASKSIVLNGIKEDWGSATNAINTKVDAWQAATDARFGHVQSLIIDVVESVALLVGYLAGVLFNLCKMAVVRTITEYAVQVEEQSPTSTEVMDLDELPMMQELIKTAETLTEPTVTHTVVELKAIAKEAGLKGYSKLNKAQLVALVSNVTAQ